MSNKKMKRASDMPVLPTADQVRRLACTMVADTLTDAVRLVTWKDAYNDPICAAELARDAVRELGESMPDEEFDSRWFRLGCVVRLARDAFPDRDTATWRFLDGAVNQFNVALEMVEEAEMRAIKPHQERNEAGGADA